MRWALVRAGVMAECVVDDATAPVLPRPQQRERAVRVPVAGQADDIRVDGESGVALVDQREVGQTGRDRMSRRFDRDVGGANRWMPAGADDPVAPDRRPPHVVVAKRRDRGVYGDNTDATIQSGRQLSRAAAGAPRGWSPPRHG